MVRSTGGVAGALNDLPGARGEQSAYTPPIRAKAGVKMPLPLLPVPMTSVGEQLSTAAPKPRPAPAPIAAPIRIFLLRT
jgi:hypothetical protein